jgi:hypothetical protein
MAGDRPSGPLTEIFTQSRLGDDLCDGIFSAFARKNI